MISYPLPTVHLNGTGRDTLIQEYREAYRKLIAFRDAFAATTCNGRDFYPQGPDAYTQARRQRDRELERIHDLMEYIEAHLTHLSA